MTIENHRQWENTRAKLRELEQLYHKKQREPGDGHARELTLRSLKKRINQFKEEVASKAALAHPPAEQAGQPTRPIARQHTSRLYCQQCSHIV